MVDKIIKPFSIPMILSFMILSRSFVWSETVQLAGTTMGSTYSVRIANWPANEKPTALHKQIEDLLASIDQTFSTYRWDSELTRVNAASAKEPVPISQELYDVLHLSREVQLQSQGTFAVTITPLVNLWKDAAKQVPPRLPTKTEIESARQSLGLDQWDLQEAPLALVKHTERLRFDVNGIVPGYAVDQVAKLLKKASYENYLIEIGGEVRAKGSDWTIGIEAPTADADRRVLFSLPIRNEAVATSGDYRQKIEIQGKRYSHILDPRNGWPIKSQQSSVTVIMDSCAEADAWATALFVHGPERGSLLADELNIAACFVVPNDNGSTDFKLIRSRAFDDYTSITKPTQPSLLHRLWLQLNAIITGLGVFGIFWLICFYLPNMQLRRSSRSGKS